MAKPKLPKPHDYPAATPVAAPTSDMWANSFDKDDQPASANGGKK